MRYTDSMKQELNRRVAACAAGFALPRYSDLPQVGLYLDQTVQFINGYFRDFPGVERLRAAVAEDLDRAVLMGLEMTVDMLRNQGRRVAQDSLEAIASLQAECMQRTGM